MRPLSPLLAILLLTACAEAAVRPQSVLYVNTDVFVPALVDTLRIDVMGTGETRTFIRPNADDWPVSFGLPASADGEPTLLRLRAYEASHLVGRNPSEFTEGLSPEDPLPSFVIDRIIEVPAASAPTEHLEVVMAGNCIGRPADPDARTSCLALGGGVIDIEADASSGLISLRGPLEPGADSRVGNWDALIERNCIGEPREESGLRDEEVCIPGGAYFLGDGRLGVNTRRGETRASVPERLVRLSPFFMDIYEVTTGRFREHADAVQRGQWATRDNSRLCTFDPDGSDDDLPMNCVSREGARQFCELDGGRLLPSEAQWEYAASGRGLDFMWPWGDEPIDCYKAAYGRIGPSHAPELPQYVPGLGTPNRCWAELTEDTTWPHSTEGPTSGGTYVTDRSFDGVFDMAANLEEWTRDSFIALTHECWDQPVLRDPVCVVPDAAPLVRGGAWSGAEASTTNSLRRGQDAVSNIITGIRCVRPAGVAAE